VALEAGFGVSLKVMNESKTPLNSQDQPKEASADETTQQQAAEIPSRFLFVDIAAQRAKQLRRGSLPRLSHLQAHRETGIRPEMPPKLERVAMDEVKAGLIEYELPDASGPKETK
jgi:DNA-directed RNA polymerase omega subunit